MKYKYDIGMLVETNQYGIDGHIIKGTIINRNFTWFSEIYYIIKAKDCPIPYRIYEHQIITAIDDPKIYIEKLRGLINKQLDDTIEKINTINEIFDQISKMV